jgi:hypothetical protein
MPEVFQQLENRKSFCLDCIEIRFVSFCYFSALLQHDLEAYTKQVTCSCEFFS